MKKIISLDMFLYLVATLLVMGFVIRLGADFYQYQQGLKSLPFHYYILGRSIVFLLPSVICMLGASYLKRKSD